MMQNKTNTVKFCKNIISRSLMNIQYISDLHIDLLHDEKIERLCRKIVVKAPILVLGGDIGNPYKISYKNFLEKMNLKYEKIFVICGNHEYYGNDIEDTKVMVRDICSTISNVVFLDNNTYIYQGYTFLGSTLWSRIMNKNNRINDTDAIKDLTVERYNDLHTECVTYVNEQLRLSPIKVVVITHHLPSYQLIDEKYLTHTIAPYGQWFASNLNNMMIEHRDKISCWIYGHTHTEKIKTVCGVDTYCNPVGYRGENAVIDYEKTIELKNQ